MVLVALTTNTFAQCGQAVLTGNSSIQGDNTPCKNSAGNYYYLSPAGGCNVSKYVWTAPEGSVITDGVLTSIAGGSLKTDSSKVWIKFKTKNGSVTATPMNSCNQQGVGAYLAVNLNCAVLSTTTPARATKADTTLSGISALCTNSSLTLSFTPLAYATGYVLYIKSNTYYPNGVCYNGEFWRQVTSVYPTSPLYAAWGWTPISYGYTYPARIAMSIFENGVYKTQYSSEFTLDTHIND